MLPKNLRKDSIKCERCDGYIVRHGELVAFPYVNVDANGDEHHYCGACVFSAIYEEDES